MDSLKLVIVGDKTLLLQSDGSVHGPFSLFINATFANPHSREAATVGLRLLHRFLDIHEIDLGRRALAGECLRSVEREWLGNLAYRPLSEISTGSGKMLKKISLAATSNRLKKISSAVAPNTAASRLGTVSQFLSWFFDNILSEAIRSKSDREALTLAYAATVRDLDLQVGRTKQGHHNQINSLPSLKYLRIVEELFVNYDNLFLTKNGKEKKTVLRDRAISLLAAEGIRPGAIGNLTLQDFKFNGDNKSGYVTIRDNLILRSGHVGVATPRAKGVGNPSYNSNITVKLWGVTALAIVDYLNSERQLAISRELKNKSKSFMFLTVGGSPISDRSTIALIFKNLEAKLLASGLLDISSDDPYVRGKYYEFNAYTLRHSAASFFYERFFEDPGVEDLMGARFGWTKKSKMPSRYANRARSDASSVDMNEFYKLLTAKLERRLGKPKGGAL